MGAIAVIPDSDHYRGYLLKDPEKGGCFRAYYAEERITWSPLALDVEPHSRRLPKGDFPTIFQPAAPVFSQRAVDVLGDLLRRAGDLHAFDCFVEPLYFFQCTRFPAVLDLAASVIERYSFGEVKKISEPAWREDVDEESFFYLPRSVVKFSSLFVSTKVMRQIESAGLAGFRFVPQPRF